MIVLYSNLSYPQCKLSNDLSKNSFNLTRKFIFQLFVITPQRFKRFTFVHKSRCKSNVLFLQIFLQQTLHHKCFPMNFTKILRAPILQKICHRLLLENDISATCRVFHDLRKICCWKTFEYNFKYMSRNVHRI